MMTYDSDDVLNLNLLSNPKALDSNRRTLVDVVEQEPRRPLSGTDDLEQRRNSGQRRRLRKQFDESAGVGHTPMFALCIFSGGTELDWDWD